MSVSVHISDAEKQDDESTLVWFYKMEKKRFQIKTFCHLDIYTPLEVMYRKCLCDNAGVKSAVGEHSKWGGKRRTQSVINEIWIDTEALHSVLTLVYMYVFEMVGNRIPVSPIGDNRPIIRDTTYTYT